MSRRLVTLVANFVDLGNGEYDLKNPNDFGVLEKTHFIQAQAQDPNTGEIQIGTLIKLEISWNSRRVPAVEFLSPEEVAFVGFEDDADVDEDEDDDADDTISFDNFEDDDFGSFGADSDLS